MFCDGQRVLGGRHDISFRYIIITILHHKVPTSRSPTPSILHHARPLHEVLDRTALVPAPRLLRRLRPAPRAPSAVLPEQLVQAVHELLRHARLAVRKRLDLVGRFRDPAEPFGQAPHVRVDGVAGPLQAEEDDAGCGLGADAVVLDQLGKGGWAREVFDVFQGDGVGVLVVT